MATTGGSYLFWQHRAGHCGPAHHIMPKPHIKHTAKLHTPFPSPSNVRCTGRKEQDNRERGCADPIKKLA